jgi:hypothetical protein
LEINKTVIVASSWSSIFTLPTLMMHGQTQIKFRPSVCNKDVKMIRTTVRETFYL